MDYKDLTVVGLAFLCGLGGAAVGPLGFLAGVVLGAGIGAAWAASTDRAEHLERRFERLESEQQ